MFTEYCPPLPNITAGIFSNNSCLQTNGSLPGMVCTIACEDGYYQVGNNEYTCGNNSDWNYPNFTECISESIRIYINTIYQYLNIFSTMSGLLVRILDYKGTPH